MSEAIKWDERFRGISEPGSAALVLLSNLHLLPSSGKALDLACGTAGNALLLAQRGLATSVWDISSVALELQQQWAQQRGLTLQTSQRDCESMPPSAGHYDVICVAHFLHRPLCAHLSGALKPGGLLFYQTFTAAKRDTVGPASPDYLLQPGELIRLFAELQLRYYRDDGLTGDSSVGERNRALLVAQKPG